MAEAVNGVNHTAAATEATATPRPYRRLVREWVKRNLHRAKNGSEASAPVTAMPVPTKLTAIDGYYARTVSRITQMNARRYRSTKAKAFRRKSVKPSAQQGTTHSPSATIRDPGAGIPLPFPDRPPPRNHTATTAITSDGTTMGFG